MTNLITAAKETRSTQSNVAFNSHLLLATFKFLPPQGFGLTRGGILGFPACIHIRNFKM